ncbi:MAG: MraY family glycosyltransferase [Arenicellales bacterium]
MFLVTVVALEVLRQNARKLGLLSYPGAHRRHTEPTPLVGGLGVFVGILLGAWLLPLSQDIRTAVIFCGTILVVMGVWDDARETSFAVRFAAQALAVGVLAWVAGVSLRDLGHIFHSAYATGLGRWGVALTIFSAVGVINAVNMSDGLDGLAGALSLVTCLALIVASYMTHHLAYAPFVGVMMAALLAFMLYNARIPGFKTARLYLGDAGSLLVGFMLAWFLIAMTQGDDRVMKPVTALWVFALPLFDAVASLLRRPIQGRSPFHADRTHYHHYLQEYGWTVNQSLLISVAAASIIASLGLLADFKGVSEQMMFFGFLGLFALYLLLMIYLDFNIERIAQAREQHS